MSVNKEEENHNYYDAVYKTGGARGVYLKHYQETPYFKVWEKSIDLLKKIENPNILEIGCGVGQFANMLFDHGYQNYKGIDFSRVAIELAQKTNPDERDKFTIDNVYTTELFQENYNTIIIFEVLEHLKDDILILNKIKKGTNVLFSVPNFDDRSHVRYFTSKKDIIERYGGIIDLKDIHEVYVSSRNIIFLGYGTKR